MFKKTIPFTALALSLGILPHLSEVQALPQDFCEEVTTSCMKIAKETIWGTVHEEMKADDFCGYIKGVCLEVKKQDAKRPATK